MKIVGSTLGEGAEGEVVMVVVEGAALVMAVSSDIVEGRGVWNCYMRLWERVLEELESQFSMGRRVLLASI